MRSTRWAAVTLLVAGLMLAACTTGTRGGRPRATPTSHVASDGALARTRFDAVTLAHPASWRAYVEPGGGDLPDNDAAFLTNAPIAPRCAVIPGPRVSRIRCPGLAASGVRRLGAGGVVVEVAMYYQQGGPARHGSLDVRGGYRGRVHVTDGDECIVGSGDSGLEATNEPRARARQPSLIYVTGCFGPESGLEQQAFRRMLDQLRVKSRADESVPVPGAAPCTYRDLAIHQVPEEGINSGQISVNFRVTDVGSRACYISGVPRLIMDDRHHHGLPFVDRRSEDVRHPGRPLYLRPHLTAFLSVNVQTCMDLPQTEVARARIRLAGIHRPFKVRVGSRRVEKSHLTSCGTTQDPSVIGTQPLVGN